MSVVAGTMNAKAFFDTNILIYGALGEDFRSDRAEQLLVSGGTISVQVLNEFVSVARYKLRRPWEDVKDALEWIRVFCPDPYPLTLHVHESGIDISERYGFHIYDAMLVASALDAGCGVLYSEDLQNRQVIESKLTIRNPFR
jgi:predicted nucleic acid-binding protein